MKTPLSTADAHALYRRELQTVWNTLRRLGVGANDVEDLTQEVFLRAFRLFERYDPTRPLRPWLIGIACHVAVDFLRLRRHRIEVVSEAAAEEEVDHDPMPDQQVSGNQERRVLARLLDSLALDRRVVLVLHDILGHTVPEIAEALDVPLNTAYSRLRLARVDFEGAVKRYHQEVLA